MSKHSFYNLTSLRTGILSETGAVTNSLGQRYRLTNVYLKSIKLSLIYINDEYSKFLGYSNRVDLLEQQEQIQHVDLRLYHDPLTNKLYAIIDRLPVCLN